MIHFNLLAAVLFCLALSCGLLSCFLLWQEIGEINCKLPEDQQISYCGMYPGKMARIRREYQRLYPGGKLHRARVAFQAAAIAFMILLLIPLGFFS